MSHILMNALDLSGTEIVLECQPEEAAAFNEICKIIHRVPPESRKNILGAVAVYFGLAEWLMR